MFRNVWRSQKQARIGKEHVSFQLIIVENGERKNKNINAVEVRYSGRRHASRKYKANPKGSEKAQNFRSADEVLHFEAIFSSKMRIT